MSPLLFCRKCTAFSTKQQRLRVDRTVVEREVVASRPAAGGESCFAGFYEYALYDRF